MAEPEPATTAGATARLASFVHGADLSDVPEPVADHARAMLIDAVGVALAAVDDPAVEKIRRVALDGVADGPARALGRGERGRATDVGLVDGVAMHALDFDDVHHRMGGHPTVPVLAAALPIAEAVDASGAGLFRAFLVGTEVVLSVADVINPGHYEVGWHPTAALGHLGAAAAAGAVLELEEAELRQALGIAVSQAGGTKANFGTMTKPYHVGRAGRAGVEAARLAADGFTAAEDAMERPFGGFLSLFEGDPPHAVGDHLDRLGDPWGLLDPPVGLKPYPCCGSTHTAADCALALAGETGFDPGDVAGVTVVEHPRRLPHTDDSDPDDGLAAKFSVQYVVARALADGELWLDAFEDDAVSDLAVRKLLNRVTVERDAAMPEWAARVVVETADGRTVEHAEDAPRGSAERRLSTDERHEKYRRCAAAALPADQVDVSLDRLEALPSGDPVVKLIDSLVAP